MGSAEVLEQLRDHRPGQVLFAHASCWTDPFPFAADVVTFLYQTNAAPWDAGRLRLDPETGSARQAEADESPVEVLAAKIVEAEGEHGSVSTREQLVKLVIAAQGANGDAAAGLFRAGGPRLRERMGSPVKSARFL